MLYQEFYKNSEAAELLNVTEANLRATKGRKSDRLIESTHWTMILGATSWTRAGMIELARIFNNEKCQDLLRSLEGLTIRESQLAEQEARLKMNPVQARYENLPVAIGSQVSQGLIGGGIMQEIDRVVIGNLFAAMAIAPDDMDSQISQLLASL
jgi:hypothetical protein